MFYAGTIYAMLGGALLGTVLSFDGWAFGFAVWCFGVELDLWATVRAVDRAHGRAEEALLCAKDGVMEICCAGQVCTCLRWLLVQVR